jgi:hypothetical protein
MYKSFWRPSGSCDLSLVLRGGGGRLRRRPARTKGRGDDVQQAGGVVGVHPVPRVVQDRHAVPQPCDLRLVAAAPARLNLGFKGLYHLHRVLSSPPQKLLGTAGLGHVGH